MGKRPNHLKPPAYLSKNPPLPEKTVEEQAESGESGNSSPAGEDRLDPTRYGDWERKGIAVDF